MRVFWGLVLLVVLGLSGCGLFGGESGGESGRWWEVYFTEPGRPNAEIVSRLVGYIDSSKSKIDVAAFEFDLGVVAQALERAKKRGVAVRWLTDDEYGLGAENKPGKGQFAVLMRAGIPVKTDKGQDLMHNKFIVFDNKIVWTGSTNLTINGTQKNNNNVIVLKSKELAGIFERQFDEMWRGEFGASRLSTVESQDVVVNNTRVRVLFSPEDKVAEKLAGLISGAKKSVRFMAFSFTHEGMGKAMLSRARAGVDVQGIFETRGSETQYSELRQFYCGGLPVRQDTNPSAFHHKVLVIDGETVVTGSFNFSNNADLRNDENVVILFNGDVAKEFLGEFNVRWGESRQPSKVKMKCR
ncbi:phospholipase D-like domain-containing protein [Ancylothrix sp. C2]|uniref:phospholipase D-like domain-containing protein n=1 Tax=Ancylothrix sp. D3o TaxID=2953691 RepID=UPI0021BB84E1|nr:phospholipase D-like domain-containing protein [Ancylothrix sp. D3o]MCT7949694.1 phospholipase D-like domain-containing protein [Ancylothrix sp. D3o]